MNTHALLSSWPSSPRHRPARSIGRCSANASSQHHPPTEARGDVMLAEKERLFPKITEEGLDDLRRRIGAKIVDTAEPWCYEATRDNIRHYAHGIGDDNPLWCDPDYAARTRYGGIVALPSFLFACNRIVSGYVGG